MSHRFTEESQFWLNNFCDIVKNKTFLLKKKNLFYEQKPWGQENIFFLNSFLTCVNDLVNWSRKNCLASIIFVSSLNVLPSLENIFHRFTHSIFCIYFRENIFSKKRKGLNNYRGQRFFLPVLES